MNFVQPITHELKKIREALNELKEYSMKKQDSSTTSEVNSLYDEVSPWEFILSMIVWLELLNVRILLLKLLNKSNKLFQKKDISVDVLTKD